MQHYDESLRSSNYSSPLPPTGALPNILLQAGHSTGVSDRIINQRQPAVRIKQRFFQIILISVNEIFDDKF